MTQKPAPKKTLAPETDQQKIDREATTASDDFMRGNLSRASLLKWTNYVGGDDYSTWKKKNARKN